MRQKLAIAALSAILSLDGGVTAAAPDKRPFEAKNLQFDVVRLGAPIGAFEGKYPKTLCDADPINHDTRQLWFHAGRPCRKADPLPGSTIVVLFTKTELPTAPIDAIAWFGNWPHASGSFPLDIGAQLPESRLMLAVLQDCTARVAKSARSRVPGSSEIFRTLGLRLGPKGCRG